MVCDTYQCPQCGALMTQTGADATTARYKCDFCGFIKLFSLTDQSNAEFLQKKSDFISRINLGFVDWRVTQWDSLHRDLLNFISRYEIAKDDIQLHLGLIACLTSGFQVLDKEKYRQCKIIFKFTEKMYKQQLKMLKKQADTNLYKSVNEYKEMRAKYKKCRNEYRNKKLVWKAVFFVFKKMSFG